MACAHSGDGRGLSKEIECGRCSQSSAAAAAVSRRYPYAHGRRRTRVRWDRRLHNGVGINHPSLIGASLHSRRFILLCYLAVVSLLIAGFIAPADAYSSSSSSASSSPKPNNKSGGGIPIEGTFKGTWVLQDDDVDNNYHGRADETNHKNHNKPPQGDATAAAATNSPGGNNASSSSSSSTTSSAFSGSFTKARRGSVVIRLAVTKPNSNTTTLPTIVGEVTLRNGHVAGIGSPEDDVQFYAFGVYIADLKKAHILLATRAAAAAAAEEASGRHHQHANMLAHARVTAPFTELDDSPEHFKALRHVATEYANAHLAFGWHPLDNMKGETAKAIRDEVSAARSKTDKSDNVVATKNHLQLRRTCAFRLTLHETEDDSLQGAIESSTCGDAVPPISLNATRINTELIARYRYQPSRYAGFAAFVAILQGGALGIQLSHAPHGSAASRVSMLSVGNMALIDSYLSLAHLAAAVVAPYAAGSFLVASSFFFLTFTAGSFRAVVTTLRARHPDFFQDWAGTRRALATLYARFYGALLAITFGVYQLRAFPKTTALLISQFYWLPQIALTAYEGGSGTFRRRSGGGGGDDAQQMGDVEAPSPAASAAAGTATTTTTTPALPPSPTARTSSVAAPLDRNYILLTSISRLLLLMYFTTCPSNLLNLSTDVPYFLFATFVVGGQAALLHLQATYGARCFIPASLARYLPRRYSYKRPLPAGAAQTDCVICMTPLSSPHMVAPCNHAFHESCLSRWMDVKLECPTCRRALEPP